MVTLLRKEWINDSQLKKWRNISCLTHETCNCQDDTNQVELQDHDSCIRGRIDTIICTNCNNIKSFDIVR